MISAAAASICIEQAALSRIVACISPAMSDCYIMLLCRASKFVGGTVAPLSRPSCTEEPGSACTTHCTIARDPVPTDNKRPSPGETSMATEDPEQCASSRISELFGSSAGYWRMRTAPYSSPAAIQAPLPLTRATLMFSYRRASSSIALGLWRARYNFISSACGGL